MIRYFILKGEKMEFVEEFPSISELIKSLIETSDENEDIPLPNVHRIVMETLKVFLSHKDIFKVLELEPYIPLVVFQHKLEFLSGMDYLMICKELDNLLTKIIADKLVKTCSYPEIYKIFGVEDLYTEEEHQMIFEDWTGQVYDKDTILSKVRLNTDNYFKKDE